MVSRMKTTIDLPDSLAREAKDVAHRQGVSLRELVVSGLRAEVERRMRRPTVDFVFPSVDGDGIQIEPSRAIELSYGLPPR